MYAPSAPPQHTSPRVRELAQRVTEVIRSYRQSHPDMGLAEIRQAIRLSLTTLRAEIRGGAVDAAKVLPVVLGVAVLLLGLGLFMARQQGDSEQYVTMAVAVAVGIIAVLVAFVARNRS
jgi:predicted nuclease with RNAse H fold